MGLDRPSVSPVVDLHVCRSCLLSAKRLWRSVPFLVCSLTVTVEGGKDTVRQCSVAAISNLNFVYYTLDYTH